MIWNWNRTFTEEGYRQLNVFDHLISQKVRSSRTFSKLLDFSTTVRNSIKLDMWRIYIWTVNVSKIWSKFSIFIWAFGRLHSMVMIWRQRRFIINTKKYVLPFSLRDNYRDKFWFDIIIYWWWMIPDYHFISSFGSVYPVHSKTELQSITLTRK